MPSHKLAFATLTLAGLTILSGLVLSSSLVSADDVVDEINITVPVSCTLSGTGMNSHNAEINNGTYNSAIGETTLKAFCNDNEGFAIYAIGYTDNEEGKNVLTSSTLGDTYDIATGTATSGNDSNWAMKLSTITSPAPTYPIIIAGTNDDTQKEQGDPDYSIFQEVPDDYTKVAYRTSNTDIGASAEGATLTTTYQAYISSTQPAGTYTGQVKYTLVHPHTAEAPEIPRPLLYDLVSEMSKGTLTENNLTIRSTITAPTSANRDEDTSNSGVYEYEPAIYGIASDASNDYPIYFYRGVLESNPGSSGSEGSSETYPNYVKLANNTCWRIFRTTGSGGIKMIYNGEYNISSGTCANFATAFYSIVPYTYSQNEGAGYNMGYVGYTFNPIVINSTAETPLGTILGNDSNPNLNTTINNIKGYVEYGFYQDKMMAYTNMLESSAGYCNDRTVYKYDSETQTYILQSESSTAIPYRDSTNSYYFGGYVRNNTTTGMPSLTCPHPIVDLYRYVENSNGNYNELKYPVALLTADEASLSGSGSSDNGTKPAYNYRSFLGANDPYWLLTPHDRYKGYGGLAYMFVVSSNSNVGNRNIDYSAGAELRPVISLKHETKVVSGSGVATDPWLIKE